MKFAIGRYYFDSLFREEANKTFIEDLMKSPYIEEKSFEYALGDFHAEEHGGLSFLRGTFGKIRHSDFPEVYDKENKEFKKEELKHAVEKKIEFLISHTHHLIFFEYDSQIKPEYVADKVKKIFKRTASYGELEMDFIFEEKDVYKAIEAWDKIDKISFKKLRPSNPSSLDDFKDIEQLIKETNSSRTDIELQAPEPKDDTEPVAGINADSKLVRQALALSAHGYGEAKLEGKERNKSVEVSTTRFIKKVEVNFTEDGALDKIIQTIEEIQKHEKDDAR